MLSSSATEIGPPPVYDRFRGAFFSYNKMQFVDAFHVCINMVEPLRRMEIEEVQGASKGLHKIKLSGMA